MGTPDCPSVGSAAHQLGFCKPCDFFHRNCCTNAAACKFCHLCGPEESKNRKKHKLAMLKVARRQQRANAEATITARGHATAVPMQTQRKVTQGFLGGA